MDGDCATGTAEDSWLYGYDGDGVRVSTAHFAGGSSTPDLTTRYYFGGALETSGSSVKKYYSFAGQTVAMRTCTTDCSLITENWSLSYFLSDHIGSTSVVLDANGGILEQQRYLPFGGPRTDLGSPLIASTDLTYTGQRNLPDTGLMDYDARFYSPYITHFSQPDTIVPNLYNPQDWNRYSYARNNPLKYTDPTGHDPWWDDPYFNLEVFVSAGIYQQNAAFCNNCNMRPRGVMEFIFGNDDTRGIGPAKAKDIEMKTPFGDDYGDDPNDPRGYGLGLAGKDQNDMEVAKLAMFMRMEVRLKACREAGCSATDEVIVAALAANQSISPVDIKRAFQNKKNFTEGGTFDWLTYLKTNEKGQEKRNRHTLLLEFVYGIPEKSRSPRVNWKYIQGLINAQ